MRYFSGLLLGIGLCFWAAIPNIERHTARFRSLAAVVFIGGCARLYGIALSGPPENVIWFALLMELLVTPALCVWQNRFAARAIKPN